MLFLFITKALFTGSQQIKDTHIGIRIGICSIKKLVTFTLKYILSMFRNLCKKMNAH